MFAQLNGGTLDDSRFRIQITVTDLVSGAVETVIFQGRNGLKPRDNLYTLDITDSNSVFYKILRRLAPGGRYRLGMRASRTGSLSWGRNATAEFRVDRDENWSKDK